MAGELRGEPNAHGVRVKRLPSLKRHAFWSDDDYASCVDMLDEDMQKPLRWVSDGRTVVYPSNGIGTTLGGLPAAAPAVWDYLNEWIERLRSY